MLTVYFTRPLVLLLLLIVPLLFWWHFRQRRISVRFSSLSLLRNLPRGRSRRVRFFGTFFRMLALAMLIIALAGPRWPDEGSRIPTEGINIGIVLDVSGSMRDLDFKSDGKTISRLDAAKKAFRLFVLGGEGPKGEGFTGRGNDRISLVVFAKTPETISPLTLSHSVLVELMEKQEARTVPDEAETNIGDGIAWGLNSLVQRGKGKKILVLLTDGEQTVPPPALKPRQAAQLAGNLDVKIYVIDTGKAPEDVVSKDPQTKKNREQSVQVLKETAKISGGKYFKANDTTALLNICKEIDQIEKISTPSFVYRRYHQAFGWFALASFLLLVNILTLEQTVWRRIP